MDLRTPQGAFFANVFQDQAITETTPDHAVTMSGLFPRSTDTVRTAAGRYAERASNSASH